MNTFRYLALAGLLFFSPLVFSSDFVFFGSLSDGGETFVETDDEQDLRAGGLLQFSAGLENKLSSDLLIQAMFGLKFDGITASDGEASFIRYPIDVSLIKRTEQFELGMGFTYHTDPQLNIDINGLPNLRVNFDNALGMTLGMGLRSNKLGAGLRLTFIDYEVDNWTVDGNSLGLYLSLNL